MDVTGMLPSGMEPLLSAILTVLSDAFFYFRSESKRKVESAEIGKSRDALKERLKKILDDVARKVINEHPLSPEEQASLKELAWCFDDQFSKQFFILLSQETSSVPVPEGDSGSSAYSNAAIQDLLERYGRKKGIMGLNEDLISLVVPEIISRSIQEMSLDPELAVYATYIQNSNILASINLYHMEVRSNLADLREGQRETLARQASFGGLLQQTWKELRIDDPTKQKAIEQARIRLLRQTRDIFNIKLAGARREFIGHFKYISPNLRRVKKINGRYPSDYRQEENTEPIDFASLMTLAIKTQRVLIIAPAGVGKTTFLRKLHLDLLEKGLPQAPLPIFMDVDDFLKSRPDFTKTVTKKLGKIKAINNRPEKAGQITNTLDSQGRLCFVLDSLDQSSDFAGINTCFRIGASECLDKNIVVVACRTEQIDSRSSRGIEGHHQEFQEFEWVLLDEFTDEQLREYLGPKVRNWLDFDNLPDKFQELLRTGYYANIAKCLGLEPGEKKQDLKTRTDLLDKFIKYLFLEAERRGLNLGFDDEEIIDFLCKLSFDTLGKGHRQVFPVNVSKEKQYDDRERDILKKITEAQWIYRRIFEGKSEAQYTFYHQLLQEYFAACHLEKLFETDRPEFEKALVGFPFSEVVCDLLDELLTDHEGVFDFCMDSIYQALAEADGQKAGLSNTGNLFTWLLALRDRKGEKPELAVKLQDIFDEEREQSQDTETNGKFVKIPAGAFLMGGYEFYNEQPVRVVYLSDYWISKYAETFEEFDRYCGDTGRKRPDQIGNGGVKRGR